MLDMVENIEIKNLPDFLLVTVGGEFSVDFSNQVIDLVIKNCQENNQKKALVDVRRMAGNISIMDRVRVGIYGTVLLKHNIVIALIGRDDQVLPDNFLENFMVNRGVRMRIFTDPEPGKQWLLEMDNG